ncbi:MAG: hypothetical protein Q8M19_21360 [Reyranella sp.]|nr:hypothetical protein [Reyranella sp.]
MARQAQNFPAPSVGIQVPVGRIAAGRVRWQTVLQARDKPMVYRLQAIDGLIVEVDGAARTIRVDAGASVDVQAKRIRVKAAGGDDSHVAQGRYVLVS